MIDGPPGTTSVRDRLNALKAYRAAWISGKHPVHTLMIDANLRAHLRLNVLPLGYHIEDTTGNLKFHRPAGSFSGLTERNEVFAGMSEEIDAHQPHYTTRIGGWLWSGTGAELDSCYRPGCQPSSGPEKHYRSLRCSSGNVHAKRGFASLSRNYQAHPFATRPTLQACSPLDDNSTTNDIRCSGDLVQWQACEGGLRLTEMIVFNWKTGIIVWVSTAIQGHRLTRYSLAHETHRIGQHMRNTSSADQQFQVISPTHVIVIDDGDKFSLCLYSFDPSASDDAPLAKESDCLYTLALPTRSHQMLSHWVRFAFEPPQQNFTDDHPLFSHDPALSLLALTFANWFGDRSAECFLLLIPLETLLRFDTEGAELLRGRTIPWEDWGPEGTKMLQAWELDLINPHHISVFGCRVALPHWRHIVEGEEMQCLVTVFEVHKLANEPLPTNSEAANASSEKRDDPEQDAFAAASRLVATDDEWITDSRTWKDPIRTTYPFRKTYRTIPLSDVPHRQHWKTAVFLTADGLLLLVQVCPSTPLRSDGIDWQLCSKDPAIEVLSLGLTAQRGHAQRYSFWHGDAGGRLRGRERDLDMSKVGLFFGL
ncbi:hypothetical protein NUW54_g3786 [Trametes sanguinea]|uniref:Uncharacterized protein n=1 Tax=Trametes sanguinea TaxID=158606 RepID=A0ACC1Q2V7_9APHY|nr:hypothetical protein NUW54_g3786 [Trametes sanguinea]